MVDFLIFYFIIGLAINWGLALVALYSDEFVGVDAMGFFITIPAWPITVYNLIVSFFDRG